jgi:SAM-dependent methyltransferase
MLEVSRRKLSDDQNSSFQCIDAEVFLDETTEKFDLVTSNATMHWFDDLSTTCRLISDRLTGNGSLVCSVFGPKTMQELHSALNKIHGQRISMPSQLFPDQEALENIFNDLFGKVEIKEWNLVRHYPSLGALLKHISKTGTAGWHPGQPLLNRHNLPELEKWFVDSFGDCRISYQIFMVKCSK